MGPILQHFERSGPKGKAKGGGGGECDDVKCDESMMDDVKDVIKWPEFVCRGFCRVPIQVMRIVHRI